MIKILKINKNLEIIPIIIALLVILASVSLEYLYNNMHVCKLCSYNRILWVVFCILYLIFINKTIPILSLLVNLGISIYHSALQYHLINNYVCAISFDKPEANCGKLGFTILGLPLSTYNILSVIIVLGAIYAIILRKP